MQVKPYFIKKLFFGAYSEDSSNKPAPALKKQISNIKKIWHSKSYKDFGIERIFRLFLACIQFVFPGIYIRHFSGKSVIRRKTCLDFYVIIKLSAYALLLFLNIKNTIVIFISLYFISETIFYLFNLLFLRDAYTGPISYKRNLLLTFFNFFEISLGFACIYNCIPHEFKCIHSVSDSIYFSFVNATSLGFGDIVPIKQNAKIFSTIQNIISFAYTIIILSYCVSTANQEGYNANKKDIGKTKKSK